MDMVLDAARHDAPCPSPQPALHRVCCEGAREREPNVHVAVCCGVLCFAVDAVRMHRKEGQE